VKIYSFLLKRLAQLVALALVVTSATFALASLLPGDFFTTMEANPGVRPELVAELRRQYGLTEPMHLQYLHWLSRSLRLDLGFSLHYMRPVANVVAEALATTAWLGAPALLVGLIGGILLGSVHALSPQGTLATALDVLSAVLLSLPSLLLGIGAMLLAAATGWFPVGGMASAQLARPEPLQWLLDRLHHLALPISCLSLPILATVERIQYSAARSAAGAPYLRSARARGLGKTRIFVHYVVRPSLNPVLSVLGPLFGAALSGSLVLDNMFAWPGLGQATYNALFSRDVFLLLGCVASGSLLLVLGNVIADLLLLWLDPRTRHAFPRVAA
jgi:peptide/nickel transport system permease protein